MTNSELLERRNQAVARGVASATPIFAANAENAELWDTEGKRYSILPPALPYVIPGTVIQR